MSRMRRRSVARTLGTCITAVSLAVFGAACSSSGGTSATVKTGDKLSGTVVVWDFNYNTPQGKSYPALDKEFEALHPGVTVKHVAQPATNYAAVVQAAVVSKSGPDVIALQTPHAIEQYSQVLTPLNSLISPSMKAQFDGWNAMNPQLDPNGTIYGVPYSFGATAFYYNKALWEKAGLDPNNFPTTYNGLVADLQKLKAAGITPIGGGDKQGTYFTWWLYIAVPGVMPLNACYGLSDGKTKWTDPRVKQVAQEWLSFVKDGFLEPNQAEQFVGDFSGFGNWVNGQAALVWAFPGYRPVLAKDDKTNLGTAPAVLGFGSAKPYFYMAGPSLGWSIPTWSKNKAAAWAYIQFITGQQAQQQHLNVDGVGPSNVNVNMSQATPDLTATFNLWKASPNNAHCGLTWQAAVVAEFGSQMASIEAGHQTLDGALAAVQQLQDKYDT